MQSPYVPRISRFTLPHLRHVLKITFDVTLILDVCPGNRDFLQVRQIIFFTSRLGLFPCFLPIARMCLATMSDVCESSGKDVSNIFSRKSTDCFACSFLFGLILRLRLAIFRPQICVNILEMDPATSSMDPVPSTPCSIPFSIYQSPSGFVCSW